MEDGHGVLYSDMDAFPAATTAKKNISAFVNSQSPVRP